MLKDELREIVNEYEKPLIRYAVSLVASLHEAQDLVQEAFTRLIVQTQEKSKIIREPRAWLYRVTHNLAMNYLKKKSSVDIDLDWLSDEKESTLSSMTAKENFSLVSQAMLELSQRDQQIVIMKIVDNISYKEIADELNVTVGNVGFILHKSLKKMRSYFMQNSTEGDIQ